MFFLQKMSKLFHDVRSPSMEGAAALSAHVLKELCPISKVQRTVLFSLQPTGGKMVANCYKLPVISWQLFYKLHLFQQKGVMIYNCPLKIDAGSQSCMCTREELLVRDYYFTPWTAAFFMPRHLHCVLSVVSSYNESSSLFSLSISSGGYLYIKMPCEQFCTCLLQGCSDKDSWDGW